MKRARVLLLFLLVAGPAFADRPIPPQARHAAPARGGKVVHAAVLRLRSAIAATEAALTHAHNDAERALLRMRLERLHGELARARVLERRLRRLPRRT